MSREDRRPGRESEIPRTRAAPRPHGWSQEFLLVAALCRWPSAKIDAAALRDAAAAAADWPAILAAVRRHRVDGLVHAGLKAAAIEPPAPIAAALTRRAAMIARDGLRHATESVQLARLLRAGGIEPIFLKGVTLAMLAYGTLGVKHARDIDVMVPPEQAMDAIAILRREGYQIAGAKFQDERRLAVAIQVLYEVGLRHGANGTLVELHWRLSDFKHVLQPLDARGMARNVPIGSFALPTFGEADLFAYLCMHVARHGWARLKWLADINALAARYDAMTIERLYGEAAAHGAGRAAAVTLLLCEELFGLDLRADFANRMRADRFVRWLLILAQDILGHPVYIDDRPLAKIRLEAAQLLLGNSWRQVGAVIGRQWAGTTERLAVPLPRALFFLYGIIRPPLWLGRRVLSLFAAMRARKPN